MSDSINKILEYYELNSYDLHNHEEYAINNLLSIISEYSFYIKEHDYLDKCNEEALEHFKNMQNDGIKYTKNTHELKELKDKFIKAKTYICISLGTMFSIILKMLDTKDLYKRYLNINYLNIMSKFYHDLCTYQVTIIWNNKLNDNTLRIKKSEYNKYRYIGGYGIELLYNNNDNYKIKCFFDEDEYRCGRHTHDYINNIVDNKIDIKNIQSNEAIDHYSNRLKLINESNIPLNKEFKYDELINELLPYLFK